MHIEFGQIISQIISFIIMCWVLKRYAWKPLLQILDERKNKIQSEIDVIEEQKKEFHRLNKDYEERLKNIDAYAAEKTREAIEEGKKKASEIQQEAQRQAKKTLDQTQIEMQNEILAAKTQLKNEIVQITMTATEKILQENLDPEKQKKLSADLIKQMEVS